MRYNTTAAHVSVGEGGLYELEKLNYITFYKFQLKFQLMKCITFSNLNFRPTKKVSDTVVGPPTPVAIFYLTEGKNPPIRVLKNQLHLEII